MVGSHRCCEELVSEWFGYSAGIYRDFRFRVHVVSIAEYAVLMGANSRSQSVCLEGVSPPPFEIEKAGQRKTDTVKTLGVAHVFGERQVKRCFSR